MFHFHNHVLSHKYLQDNLNSNFVSKFFIIACDFSLAQMKPSLAASPHTAAEACAAESDSSLSALSVARKTWKFYNIVKVLSFTHSCRSSSEICFINRGSSLSIFCQKTTSMKSWALKLRDGTLNCITAFNVAISFRTIIILS